MNIDGMALQFKQECFRTFDAMSPYELAQEFIRADNKSRIMFHLYLTRDSGERGKLIKERISYYSGEVGSAHLDLVS